MNIAILHHPYDAAAAERCRVHLTPLRRSGSHHLFTCSSEAAAASLDADVVLVILSASLSAWWQDSPVARAIEERREARALRVCPVLVRSCHVDGWLARLRAVPYNAPPIEEQAHPDKGWTEMATEVRRAVALAAGAAS